MIHRRLFLLARLACSSVVLHFHRRHHHYRHFLLVITIHLHLHLVGTPDSLFPVAVRLPGQSIKPLINQGPYYYAMRNDNDDSQAASRLFNLRTSLALVLLFTPARLPVRALRRTFHLS